MSNSCYWNGFSDYSFSSDEEDLREAMKKYQMNKNKIKANSANRDSIADIKQNRIREAKKKYKDRQYKMLSKEIEILRKMVQECESKDPLSDLTTLSIKRLPMKRSVRCERLERDIGFKLTKGLRRKGLDIFKKYEGEDYPQFIQDTLQGRRRIEPPKLDFEIPRIDVEAFYNNLERNRLILDRNQPMQYEIISDHESDTLIVRQTDIISIHSSNSHSIPSPSDRNSSISSPHTCEEDTLFLPLPTNTYNHPSSIPTSSLRIHQHDTLIHNPIPSISTHPISNNLNLPFIQPNPNPNPIPDSHTTLSSNKLDLKPSPLSIISISDSSDEEDLHLSDLDLNSDSNPSCSLQSSPKSSHSYRSPIQSSNSILQGKNLNTLIRESLYATLPSSLYLQNRPALIADLFRIAIEYYPSFLYYHNLLSNPIIQFIQFKRSPDSMIHITLHSSSGQYSGIDLNLSNHSVKFCNKKDHKLYNN